MLDRNNHGTQLNLILYKLGIAGCHFTYGKEALALFEECSELDGELEDCYMKDGKPYKIRCELSWGTGNYWCRENNFTYCTGIGQAANAGGNTIVEAVYNCLKVLLGEYAYQRLSVEEKAFLQENTNLTYEQMCELAESTLKLNVKYYGI